MSKDTSSKYSGDRSASSKTSILCCGEVRWRRGREERRVKERKGMM